MEATRRHSLTQLNVMPNTGQSSVHCDRVSCKKQSIIGAFW